jgi:hypothetical protein
LGDDRTKRRNAREAFRVLRREDNVDGLSLTHRSSGECSKSFPASSCIGLNSSFSASLFRRRAAKSATTAINW